MDRPVDTPYEVFTRDDAYQAGIDHLVAFTGIPPSQVVMDLGGGTGAMSLALVERCEPAELVIVDPDEEGLAVARAALGDRARYLPVAAECLHEHVPPASVDHVTVANAIHLFDNLSLATSNIFSVLRPKGTLSISTAFHRDASGEDEHRLAKATLLRALRQLRSTPKREAGEERQYKAREELSEDSLVAALRLAGFDDVTTESVPIAITPDFLAAFLQTDIFALAVLPDYDPVVSRPVLGKAVMDAAANDKTGGLYMRNWLFAKATKPAP